MEQNNFKIPPSVQNVVEFIVSRTAPKQVILFGSRARLDFRNNSDFDLAVKGRTCSENEWNCFLVDLEELSISFLPIEVVEYEKLTDEFRANIDREGTILYEKK